jgi:hypothetical protein
MAALVRFCGNGLRRAQIEAIRNVNYPREVQVRFDGFAQCKHRFNTIRKKLLDRVRQLRKMADGSDEKFDCKRLSSNAS